MIYKASKNAIILWKIRLLVLGIIPAFFVALFLKFGSDMFWIATTTWISIFLILAYIYYPIWYKNFSCTIKDDNLAVNSGIFFRTCRSINIRNVQYAVLMQTPLQRILKLATVVIFVAGGAMFLPNLDKTVGDTIRESVILQD
ncbi:MAG: PH domain-containing protein [Oscillospiraceae bacterium]